jgi:hypothetical protein
MQTVQAALWVVFLLVFLAIAVRLHERLSRRGQLHRHGGVDGRAQAGAGGAVRRLLQLPGVSSSST